MKKTKSVWVAALSVFFLFFTVQFVSAEWRKALLEIPTCT